jgi:beta-glucosidase
MGVAFVTGVQGSDPDHPKAVATSKHFAVHSGPESQRHTFDVHPSPRDLEETYLPAFRATVVDGPCRFGDVRLQRHRYLRRLRQQNLLVDHLRKAWGFKGFVVSIAPPSWT